MFLINRGELDGRFDAGFYFERGDYSGFIKLSKVAKISGGKRLPLGHNFSSKITPYRYLRVGDIDWDGNLDCKSFKYLPKDTYDLLTRYEISNNNLLIAIVGATVGKVALLHHNLDDRIILTENCAKIVIKSKNISSEYLFLILQSSIIQKQIQLNFIQTTLPKLGLDRLESLKIPLIPDIDSQHEIVKVLKTASNSKKQKLAKAEVLLDSIDNYLLTELGINHPEVVANTLKNRIFTRNLSEVSGGRFDAFYYQNTFNKNIDSVLNSNYPAEPLKNIIKYYLIKGKLPKEEEKGGKLKVIQINSIKKDGSINTNKLLTSEDIFYKEQKLINNDVLIVITGATIGKIAFWNIEGDFYLGGDLVKFQTKENINPYFIYSYLRFTASQIEIKRNITGATNGHLSPDDIKNILIPLPPIEKQTEIANHIQTLRNQAKQLQHQAKTELEQAKQQVERMILGEH